MQPITAYPGVRYEAVLYFPPLPESIDRITVVTPTTAGEFTGVPVVDGRREPPFAPEADRSRPPAGSTVAFPTRSTDAPATGRTYDLYALTEGPVKSTTTSRTGDDGSYGEFGAFSVIDPASKTTYRAVRMGPAETSGGRLNLKFVDPGWAVFQTDPGTSNRGFFYVPAPPPDVTSMTFDAGPFGKVPDVPIR